MEGQIHRTIKRYTDLSYEFTFQDWLKYLCKYIFTYIFSIGSTDSGSPLKSAGPTVEMRERYIYIYTHEYK